VSGKGNVPYRVGVKDKAANSEKDNAQVILVFSRAGFE